MGQKSKNAGNKKKNIYYNSTPSKEYGNMNDEKKKVNEELLDWTLNYIIKRTRAWHHHGSDTPTSARAIFNHTDQYLLSKQDVISKLGGAKISFST